MRYRVQGRLAEPGYVELLRGDGVELRHDHVSGILGGPGGDEQLRREWPSMGKVLGQCLLQPLSPTPGGDQGAFRSLLRLEQQWWWHLELSGNNRCSLEGALMLHGQRDELLLDQLSVQGKPWRQGGRELAEAILRLELRARAEHHWDTLDEADRVLALLSLERDPDPAAEELLRALAQKHPRYAADIEARLQRRALSAPGSE